MFAKFKRKKKQENDADAAPAPAEAPKKKRRPGRKGSETPDPEPQTPAKPKKKFKLKTLIIILMILAAVGLSAYVVWQFYFSGDDETPQYTKQTLEHVSLPEEIMQFSFNHLYDVYQRFIEFNTLVLKINGEINRIEEIAKKYPDQKKITDKELKTWIKARDTLLKEAGKIEKTLKDIYVLYAVNMEQGLSQVESAKADILAKFESTLTPVRELTSKIDANHQAPSGLLQKAKQKITKIF
ncbi:MAG: hypothetical protein D3926_14045 [Desulfobacteraceae bacterium]|nr:MAG: hypothetical protein D3926_14045 [Desulfobacteraceae bacterium]